MICLPGCNRVNLSAENGGAACPFNAMLRLFKEVELNPPVLFI